MSLTDVLQRHGIAYHLGGEHKNVRPGAIGVDCPRCGKGTEHFHLAFWPNSWKAHCWQCGKLDAVELLVELTGEPAKTVKGWLHGSEPAERVERPRGKLVLPRGTGPLLAAHKGYLSGRGLDPADCEQRWGIGGTGHSSNLPWRLVFRWHDGGKPVSWSTRTIGKEKSYIGADPDREAVDRKTLLYGEQLAGQAIIVVESELDAVAIGPGGVATGGVGYTEAQLARIARHPSRAVCFDAETTAQRRARQLVTDLSVFGGRTVRVELESGKDAIRASKREMEQLRRMFL